MTNSQNLLKKFFGYDNFRPGQEEIINNILNQSDCLGIMPTGAGKSICYQIPAMILPGVTIHKMAHVAAGSVVTKDVPEYTRVGGVPARFMKDLRII